jgi:hypothetical protein
VLSRPGSSDLGTMSPNFEEIEDDTVREARADTDVQSTCQPRKARRVGLKAGVLRK